MCDVQVEVNEERKVVLGLEEEAMVLVEEVLKEEEELEVEEVRTVTTEMVEEVPTGTAVMDLSGLWRNLLILKMRMEIHSLVYHVVVLDICWIHALTHTKI